jgi:predicted SprT family Zn-dependent metalloprotease
VNLIEAHYLALSLMEQHNLSAWRLDFTQTLRVAGTCRLDAAVIEISERYIRVNGEPELREIMLHEIAHAITGRMRHDRVWRAVAKSLGCTGERRPGMLTQPRGRWRFECGKCGALVERYRKPKRRYSCRKCSGGRFDERYLLREVSEETEETERDREERRQYREWRNDSGV